MGFEPMIRVLQTLALATWPRRHADRILPKCEGMVKFEGWIQSANVRRKISRLDQLIRFCFILKMGSNKTNGSTGQKIPFNRWRQGIRMNQRYSVGKGQGYFSDIQYCTKRLKWDLPDWQFFKPKLANLASFRGFICYTKREGGVNLCIKQKKRLSSYLKAGDGISSPQWGLVSANKKRPFQVFLERAMGFEPTTFSLARRHSTN